MVFSIRTKIVLTIGLPLAAVYLGMLWFEYRLGKREALAAMESHLTESAARWASELDEELGRTEQVARTLAATAGSTPNLSEDQIKTWLRENLQTNPKIYELGAAFAPYAFDPDREGVAFCYDRSSPAGLTFIDIARMLPDYAGRDWFRPLQSGSPPFWSEPYYDKTAGNRLVCTFTAPVFRDGKFLGAVTADVLADNLLARFNQVNLGGGYYALISKKGAFIAHPDASLPMRQSVFSLAKRLGLNDWAKAGRQMTSGTKGMCLVRDYPTGEPAWMVFAPIESSDWSLAAILPEHEVLAPIYARLYRMLSILAAGGAATLGIVLWASRRVTRPINRLTEASESLAQGNLESRIAEPPGNDEIARLARTFNAMVANLKTNVEGRIQETAARKEIEGELRAAREIQAALLPAMLPPDPRREFALYAVNAPAKLVAGDFFDFFYVAPDRLALVMADVSGKGIPAALFMAVVRTRLRDLASPEKTPAEIIAELNRSLAEENDSNMFVSLFFGLYETTSGELTYVNAGHNPPLVVRQTGKLEFLEPTGPLVAPFPDAAFHEVKCPLESQELLILYTDGITEAVSRGGQRFGDERLEELLRAIASEPTEEICREVIQAVSDFSCGDLFDDATILAFKPTLCKKRAVAETKKPSKNFSHQTPTVS